MSKAHEYAQRASNGTLEELKESDAVVVDEDGKARFKTTGITFRPLGNPRNEIVWAVAMTIVSTGLIFMWFYFLATT